MNGDLYNFILNKEHHKFRKDILLDLATGFSEEKLLSEERMTRRFELLTKMETPHILPDEKIIFVRTVKKLPDIFTASEWEKIKEDHFIHELGYMSNLSPNYEDTIAVGLLSRRKAADEFGKRMIDSILDLTDRYKEEAQSQNRNDIVEVLERIPRYGATNFREALQFFRILHFSLWLEGNYHNTIGRFDQYMYPYLKKDIEDGIYTEESALELLEDFFLSFNKDSDLYAGVQQGDNGQSMVLGGIDENEKDAFNLLSKLCLLASSRLKLIDPKINIRVSKNTPLEVYEYGSELTKAGLGFPQYSNDDVVIDGLEQLGYDPIDAKNYVVAACWEFIIPKCGADVANIAALSFPKIVDQSIHRALLQSHNFNDFMADIEIAIQEECDLITAGIDNLWFIPSPFMKLLLEPIKYNNFGIHGTGIATASDSLAAIKKYVFEEKTITAIELLEAVDSDFSIHSEILPLLRNDAPKMGNNDDYVDSLAVKLIDIFAASLKGKKNCRGGIYRPGTGSAMYYLWHANEIGASPDGRRKGEPFGANFSPSLIAKVRGPISVIQSFTKPNIVKAINGGPLTLEFHSSMFKNEDSVKKIAMFIKSFIDMGGHQVQLNAVNADKLKDAQNHPERYQQLVVRIWGWSAYFVELGKEYQNHVIRRQEYGL